MILNRQGNKATIALDVQKYFPKHSLYYEPFFGAGGMFFNKPKATHNFVNDKDEDVYNLFRQVIENKDELVYALESTPITEVQFKLWAKGNREATPLLNAVRFLVVSNCSLFGAAGTLRTGTYKPIGTILEQIESTFKYLQDVYFLSGDFRDFFRKCGDLKPNAHRAFVYADGPYLGTADNYSDSFKENDSIDLFDTLQNTGVKWAMSEFDHPFILQQAKERNLEVVTIGERSNIKNRRTEILVINYPPPITLLFN